MITNIVGKYLNSSIIRGIYTIIYKGKAFSLNDIYASGNQKGAFFKRKNIKDKYSKIFKSLMEESEELVPFDKFYLCITYRSRHDADNVVGMGKVFVDTLREDKKWVPDDGTKHFRGMLTFVDEDLEQNEFRFTIIDITNG
jgi:hypothetical protein